MKKTLGFILVLVLSVICAVSVFADDAPAMLSVKASKDQANVGDAITVKLDISAVKPIGRVSATVAYDASVLTFVSGDGAKAENGVITIEQLNGLGTVASVNLSFTAASQGTGSINVTSCAIYDAFEEKLDLIGSGTTIQVAEASQTETTTQTEETTTEQTTTEQQTTPETDENGVPTQGVLVDLQIDNGNLKPPFMYSIHEYSVTVPYEVEKVEIEGKTASLQDHIWYTGNAECVVGHNVRTITVTDINGNQTVYTINIIRLDKDQTETTASANDPAVQTTTPAETGKIQTTKKDKDIKSTLIPALYIVLVVLIVALVIVIIWIKKKASGGKSKKDPDKKNEKQRSKIKVSNKNNKNNKN